MAAAAISACHAIHVEDTTVSLAAENIATQCKEIGSLRVVAETSVDGLRRPDFEITAELLGAANRQARSLGGDTVREFGPQVSGVQSFRVYRCQSSNNMDTETMIGVEVEVVVDPSTL